VFQSTAGQHLIADVIIGIDMYHKTKLARMLHVARICHNNAGAARLALFICASASSKPLQQARETAANNAR